MNPRGRRPGAAPDPDPAAVAVAVPAAAADPVRRSRRRPAWLAGIAALGFGLAVQGAQPRPTTPTGKAPRLAVLLVVDQMRADYLDRFAPLFDGGLARLRNEGRQFGDARHLHATTATAPGHTCLSTGAHPRRHGIVANSYREDGRIVRAATDDGARSVTRDAAGYSSRALLVPALGDWLHARSKNSKVVAIAMKGRAATMLGGKAPDACFYMDDQTGELTTSTRYTKSLPEFVTRFNQERAFSSYAGNEWRRELVDEVTRAVGCTADDMPYEGRLGMGHPEEAVFPHRVREVADLMFTPFGDDRVLELAERSLDAWRLGEDDDPDLLLVSLSAADYIGHAYGMESVEIAEYYAWLDRRLPRFFAALDAAVGQGGWFLALSADHGVSPMVERLQAKGLPAGRIRLASMQSAVEAELDRWFGDQNWVESVTPDLYLSTDAIRASGADPAIVRETAADAARTFDGVRQAWPCDRLQAHRMEIPESFLLSYHPDRSGDVIVQLERHHHLDYLELSPYVKANHATDQDYDQRIPIVFLGAGVIPGRDGRPAASIDVAPTIAAWLGVVPPATCDGQAIDLGETAW